jgi:hypothetical protein
MSTGSKPVTSAASLVAPVPATNKPTAAATKKAQATLRGGSPPVVSAPPAQGKSHPTSTAANNSCNPPIFIDKDGIKRVKRHCIKF